MAFEQVKLPYGAKDLEPVIDELTVETHYGKHHATYTATLNNLVKEIDEGGLSAKPLGDLSIEGILGNLDLINDEAKKTAVRNNGGGFYNHNLYFSTLAPVDKDCHTPKGKLAELIERDFADKGNGSAFENLKADLKTLALGQFGSGWSFLSVTPEGKLVTSKSPNQDNPISEGTGNVPLMCVDVWEHAYYLKYKNLRADYIDALFGLIDWDAVAKRLEAAL